MFLYDVSVNYGAVVVGMIIYWVLGAIWYSPYLFGSCMKCDIPGHEHKPCCPMPINYLLELAIGFAMSYVLAVIIEASNGASLSQGVIAGIWAWIGFIATTHVSVVIWGKKSVTGALINAGFLLSALILIGLTISGMK